MTMVEKGLIFFGLILLSGCLCNMRSDYNSAYENGYQAGKVAYFDWTVRNNWTYADGVEETECVFQREAVRRGFARWEGKNNEWFIWNGDDQKYPVQVRQKENKNGSF